MSQNASPSPVLTPQRWLSYLIILGSLILIPGEVLIPRNWVPLLLVLSCAFIYGGIMIRNAQAVSIALLSTLITFFFWLPGMTPLYPLNLVLALTIYGILVRFIPALRSSARWFRFGRLNRSILFMMLGAIVLSSLALVAWYQFTHPNLQDLEARIPTIPCWMLPLLGIGFSLLNAAVEEILYRGVMYSSLESLFASRWVVILIQAIIFGCAHLYGFPRGLLGVLLATFYGGMMGVIRHYSQGLFAPWLTHVFADLIIFALLLSSITC